MKILPTTYRVAIALVSSLFVGASTLHAQDDPLARAKEFYASAAYEEALQVLLTMHSTAPSVEASEVAAYQVFCLVALGRTAEAKHAIETIVHTDPLYHPSDAQASPRVRAVFEEVRRPLLPEIARQSYAKAKDDYAKKDLPAAAAEFDRVIALLDEMEGSADPGVADLRTLAAGFRDLAKVAPPVATPPATPEPAPPAGGLAGASTARNGDATPSSPVAAATPNSSTPGSAPIYSVGDADVKAPTAISQVMPRWSPANPVEAQRDFRGSLEIVIGEDGKVLAAGLTKSVQPAYDAALLKAAQDWKFRPAMKDGTAVKYRLALDIHLGR